VSDNAQTAAEKAKQYQQAVEQFEKLDKEVDALLSSRGGHTDRLTDEEYTHYRELAELRDLAYNRMKTIERDLLGDS
jgi:hypothetical protein